MTTLLVTKDFILADRAYCTDYASKRILAPKIFKAKDNKSVVAIIGDVGFTRHKDEPECVIMAFITAITCFQNRDSSEEVQALIDKVQNKSLRSMKETFSNGARAVVLYTAKDSFVWVDGEKLPTVLYEDLWFSEGSGGKVAHYLHALGVPAEEIMGHVSEIDDLTSRQFDIVYRKELIF